MEADKEVGRARGVGIVDNDRCALEMIAALVERTEGFRVLWKAANPQHALEHCLFDARQPDAIILDLSLNGISGVEVCRRIRARSGAVGVLCATAYPLERYRDAVAEAGAQALLSKDALTTARFPEALAAVSAGRPYPADGTFLTAGRAHEKLLSAAQPAPSPLSARETEVLRYYAEDYTTKEIAARLHLSENTIFSHLSHAMRKLHQHGKTETIRTFKKLSEASS